MAANDGHSEAPAKQAPAGGRRDGRGRFPKGTSGNPRGRQPRGLATVERLRTALAEELPAIIRSVVEKAKAGDIGASKLILERLLPPLRSSEVTVVLDGVTGTRTDQGQAILQSMASGVLSPSQAAQLLGALAAQAKIAEVDELERRLALLEEKLGGGDGQQRSTTR